MRPPSRSEGTHEFIAFPPPSSLVSLRGSAFLTATATINLSTAPFLVLLPSDLQELVTLLPAVLSILRADIHNAGGAMHILEAFACLGGREFVVAYGEGIATALTEIAPGLTEGRDLRSLCQLLDSMSLSIPAEETPLLPASVHTETHINK